MGRVASVTALSQELDGIGLDLVALIASSPVERFDPRSGFLVVVGAPEYVFKDLGPEQQKLQLSLRRRFAAWFERFDLLFAGAPEPMRKRIETARRMLVAWIEQDRNHSITQNREENAKASRQALAPFRELLALLPATSEVIVVPDTNALTACPDPVSYSAVAGRDDFTFLLLPTVLGELEAHKISHRDSAYRDKVKAVLRRIRGWFAQGDMNRGVTVAKSITVRARAPEPRMDKTLSWLDREVSDDRILASVLELQVEHPGAAVVLVTGDLNLRNKGAAAMVEWAETPGTE